MPDLPERIQGELRARRHQLEPLVAEARRPEKALRSLAVGRAAGAPGARREAAGSRAPGPPSSARRKRAQAPRGQTRAAVLAAIERRPGATAREICEATGVSVNVVHAALSKLRRAGVIERDGERGHRIATGSG